MLSQNDICLLTYVILSRGSASRIPPSPIGGIDTMLRLLLHLNTNITPALSVHQDRFSDARKKTTEGPPVPPDEMFLTTTSTTSIAAGLLASKHLLPYTRLKRVSSPSISVLTVLQPPEPTIPHPHPTLSIQIPTHHCCNRGLSAPPAHLHVDALPNIHTDRETDGLAATTFADERGG